MKTFTVQSAHQDVRPDSGVFRLRLAAGKKIGKSELVYLKMRNIY